MLPNAQAPRIASKEMTLFFASPTAYLFLGSFVTITLFVFFWADAFFARNIADVRPMFEWMPILLIFLSAAITMRMWSEERRTGTLEFIMTLPTGTWRFVLGKFMACMWLLVIALLLTTPLPITVSLLANLDWGPVIAGYLATLLLGAAYISIGLFVSARSDNQIVSLMITTLVCGLFYLVGAGTLTDLFGNQAAEVLRALGSGSRFTSITRGVLDFRDLYYYISVTLVFLTLNVYALERQRWARDGSRAHHRRWQWVTALLVLNILAANFWLSSLHNLRTDVTRGQIYSLSPATRDYLSQLREPLLIRGYFSAKTHPLLSPLVPRLRDLLSEYRIAGQGKVRVEFVDPTQHPELEEEANRKYGIKPVPFQVSDKYQAALVNSYFNILVKYGDEYQVLGFRDLIEVKARSETDLDVQLRNPEYDITRSIKKVLYGFQSSGDLFDSLSAPVEFTGYVSADEHLPEILRKLKQGITMQLQDYVQQSKGRLTVRWLEPEADNGKIADQIRKDYGFKPMAASLLDTNTFYFYMTLSSKGQVVQIPLPEDYKADGFKRGMEAGLKRFASGFLKTVGLVAPQSNPYLAQMGMSTRSFAQLQKTLSENMTVKDIDLKDGQLPSDIDLLVLAAPENLDRKQLFAVDQFLMQGGTVILATAPFSAEIKDNQLSANAVQSGLEDWLSNYGITLEKRMVMDPQNAAFPIPVTRNVGGFSFQEIRMLDYPYFVDVRGKGFNPENTITAGLQQVTMPWSSPIKIDKQKMRDRKVISLLSSSDKAWSSDSLDVMPRVRADGGVPFPPGNDPGRKLLAVAVEGRFSSYFKGKDSPLLGKEEGATTEQGQGPENTDKDKKKEEQKPRISGVIEQSPESSRLIVFASNEFLEDQILRLAGAATGTKYNNPLLMVANAVEWSLEDRGLLSIRARGHFSRTLPPMERDEQVFWEYMNYGMVLLGLVLVAVVQGQLKKRRRRRYQNMLSQGRAAV